MFCQFEERTTKAKIKKPMFEREGRRKIEVEEHVPFRRDGSMTESLILAQNERWRRVLSMQVERMAPFGGDGSGGRVSNTWVICPGDGNSTWKHVVIPDTTACTEVRAGKGATAPPRDEPAAH